MDAPPTDAWITAIVLILWPASLLTWVALFALRSKRGHFLPYEPRRPVPWTAPVALLAVLFVAVTLLASVGAESPQDPKGRQQHHEEDTGQRTIKKPEDRRQAASEASAQLLGFIVFQTTIIGGVVVAVALLYQPGARDLGLPCSLGEFRRDVVVGVVAWLAAIAPVQAIQLVMLLLLGMQDESPGHPLFEMVTEGGPNVTLLILATLAAVAVAPFTEETLFRLLLQGWLEKWEDGWLRLRGREAANSGIDDVTLTPVASAVNAAQGDDRAAVGAGPGDWSGTAGTLHTEGSLADPHPDDGPMYAGLTSGVGGLPHGVLPVLCSALPFALAHYGYGPDPIAIFFLALILGYVYQRTHRILPCMIAHALLNGVAVVVMWRMVFAGNG